MAETIPYELIHQYERGPSAQEMSQWQHLLNLHQRAGELVTACSAIFNNGVILTKFAADNDFFLETINPELEQRFLQVLETYKKLTKAIRGCKDRKFGIQFSAGDIDILAPDAETAEQEGFGAIPLIIVGVVVVAGAIAAAYWATQNAIEISNQARALVEAADNQLCSNPASPICKKWETRKKQTNYAANKSLADSVQTGISRVGNGLIISAVAALGIGILWRQLSK